VHLASLTFTSVAVNCQYHLVTGRWSAKCRQYQYGEISTKYLRLRRSALVSAGQL